MYIRKSPIKSKKNGDAYFSYRLVESVRADGKVKQTTLLNLGKHFAVDPASWNVLANRIHQLIQGADNAQQALFNNPALPDENLEALAQRYAMLLLQKMSAPLPGSQSGENTHVSEFYSVDINHVNVLQPRSIGAETLALHAFKRLQLDVKLKHLGFNEKDLSAAIGTIIGRMIHPGSERETHRWLQDTSALDELIGQDHGTLSLDRLYKISDKLVHNKSAIEAHLCEREKDLFNLQRKIILYDLTNTFFEGQAKKNSKAAHGRSKEKRKDCPLVTLGLVLDGDGFPLGSSIFEGNVSEPKTLHIMLESLHKATEQQGATVVLDAGIASQENLDWLKEHAYHYIVVSRARNLHMPDLNEGAVVVKPAENDHVIAQRIEDPDTGEIFLYCHSQKREAKELAIRTQFTERYEAALKNIQEGLSKKNGTKKYEKILERLGRLKEKHARVAQDYQVDVDTDSEKKLVTALTWTRKEIAASKDVHSGVYCLRTDLKEITEQDLWETYVMLTEVEASFRSLKSELGLRPIYHQTEERVNGHIFITLLAYHLVQTLRSQLKEAGINLSWESIRNIMASQRRVTVSMRTADQKQIHLRTTTQAEAGPLALYRALGVTPDVLKARKTVTDRG